MTKVVIFVIFIVLAFNDYFNRRSVPRPPGLKIAGQPEQQLYLNLKPGFRYQKTFITPQADYKIKARVLSTERYWLGETARLAPIDVAVGWNEMSDTTLIEKLKISQSGRYYFYSWKEADLINPQIIIKTSANMHLIPANQYIADEIKKLRPGHIVSLVGQLVNVELSDGEQISTSLSREDTGAGACELMWVTSIQIQDEVK